MSAGTADSPLLDALGRFHVLSAGSFVMGNDRPIEDLDGISRLEHAGNGPPLLTHILNSVAMLETCVTFEAYRKFSSDEDVDRVVFTLPNSGDPNERWLRTPFLEVNKHANFPVVGVSWSEAAAFCRRVTSETGQTVRLPTEAEWEYACRAGSQTLYHWGDAIQDAERFAWFDRNSGMSVHAVSTKEPNRWGLYDMTGNVWEWCDSGRKSGDTEQPDRQPIRGGAACHHATSVRSAHRFQLPTLQRNAFLGFRCVVEVPQ